MKRSVFGRTARVFAFGAVLIVISASYYAVDRWSLLHPCANDLRGELVSPDTHYIAAYYVRDCGAATNFSTYVSVRPSQRNFDFAKDVRLFVANGICEIDVEWSAHVLHIHYPASCLVNETAGEWKKVKV
jgi:hypothetical protein